jgi:hypothetical protein
LGTCAANNIPRVTEILKSYSGYDNVPKNILENAAQRGTAVHALCAGIAKGAWVPDSMVQEEYKGYVSSFMQWNEAVVKEYVVIEKRYTDETKRFSGQVDFVIRAYDGELYLADLKTTAKPHKTHPIQMAAYTHLLKSNGIEVKGAALIYLDKEGVYPPVHHYVGLHEELKIFEAALQCWNYFNKRKE